MLCGMSCLSGNDKTSVNDVLLEDAYTSPKLTGNQVGDFTPDFSILLTNGETVSHSILHNNQTPVFLFFLVLIEALVALSCSA